MSYNELKERGTVDFPIELYNIDKSHSNYEMVSHWHNEFEIIRIVKGKMNVKLNNHSYIANAGDIFFVNPETIHSAMPDYDTGDCVYQCLDFSINFLSVFCDGCRYFFEGIQNSECVINEYVSANNVEISTAVNKVFDAMAHRSSGYKFSVIGEMYLLFGKIIDLHLYTDISSVSAISPDKNVHKLKKALVYLRDNFDKQITLEDMSMAAEMSPKYFCYFFKEMTRKSPVEYLNTYRIEKASRYLLNSSESVTDISFMCGFNDLSYFIKTFKAYKGITPAKFRKGNI